MKLIPRSRGCCPAPLKSRYWSAAFQAPLESNGNGYVTASSHISVKPNFNRITDCMRFNFTEWEYLLLALVSALPAFLVPLIFVGEADRNIHWKDRYWVKASVLEK
nr:cycloeucalenol cycloisomerase [Ipomoea batatas]